MCPNSGHFAPHNPKCRCPRHNLIQDKWLNDRTMTDADEVLIEQRFGDMETNLHASVSWEEAKIRLMAPFKR